MNSLFFKENYEKSILSKSNFSSLKSLASTKSYRIEHEQMNFCCKEGCKKIKFPLYIDSQIITDDKWRIQLKKSENDDDVETDEEHLQLAERLIIKDNRNFIESYKSKRINCRNLNKYNFLQVTPKIILKVEENLNN